MTTNIPEARRLIQSVIDNYLCDECLISKAPDAIPILKEALEMMTRTITRKTPHKHHGPNDEQKATIRHLANTTLMSQMEIADLVGVNPGRVSEVINGLR